jgi:hypothetical protein
MSIYVFISRRPSPLEDHGPEISESEWREVALSQHDFRIPAADEIDAWSGASDLLWTGGGTDPWRFSWNNGQVEVKGATESSIVRMRELAQMLHARVVSETGEIFDEYGRHAGFEKWSEFN